MLHDVATSFVVNTRLGVRLEVALVDGEVRVAVGPMLSLTIVKSTVPGRPAGVVPVMVKVLAKPLAC